MVIRLRRLARAFTFVGDPEGNNPNNKEKFDWSGAIADSFIVAGLNFFSTLSGLGAAQLLDEPSRAFTAAFVAAGVGFFITLASKRGLKTQHQGGSSR